MLALFIISHFQDFSRDFFEFTFLNQNGLIIMFSIIAIGIAVFELMKSLAGKLSQKLKTTI